MVSRREQQPEWIQELAAEVVAELVEHVVVRAGQDEQRELDAGRDGLRPGQLGPALVLAVQDRLKPELDGLGRGMVEQYVDGRRADGVTAGAAQGEELGPLLGMSRVGVYHAFGRQQRRPRA